MTVVIPFLDVALIARCINIMSHKIFGSGLPRRSFKALAALTLALSSILLIISSVSADVSGLLGPGLFASGGQGSTLEQEPNETVEQANPITVPGQRTGTVRYGDPAVVEFTYNNGPKDRVEDLFSFSIAGETAQRIEIQLSFSNPAADLDLILYQRELSGALTALGVSSGSATTERIAPGTPLAAGNYLIGVTAYDDPANTAQTSYTLLVTGETTAAVPVIGSLNPVSASAGGGAFSLVVNGRNFYAGQSVVRWNDQSRPTTYINSEQLVAFLTAADIATAGTASVTVDNPTGLGGSSSPVSFQVLPAGVPEIEVEPNETSLQAVPLGIPGRRSGSVAVGDAAGVTLTMITGQADPVEDLFAVNLMESRRLDLRLTGNNANADLALYLLQERETPGQFTLLGNSRLKGPVQQITTPIALPSGRYLVGVSAVTGASGYIVEANVSADRRLQLNAASAAPGSTVSVPITFSAQGTENQMAFSLAYDPTRMSGPVFVSGKALASAQVRADRTEEAQGRLGLEIRLPEGQSFDAGLIEIGRVDLKLAATTELRTSRIEFTDRPIVRSLVDRNNTGLIGSYDGGTVVAIPGFEADLMPRPYGNGDGRVTIADWTQTGRFVASLDAISEGSEFQRADSAPKTTNGDGRLTVADWVLAGRYAAGLDQPVAAGGPSVPGQAATASGQAVKIYQHGTSTDSLWQIHSGEGVEQDVRTIRIRPDLFSRGKENELVIELVSKGDENAIGFSLVFDISQMNYLRTLAGSDSAGAIVNVNTSQLAQGRIGIGLALPTNQSFQSGVRQIVRIVFAVPNGGTVNNTTIGLIDQPVAREVVDSTANILPVVYAAGEVRLDPPADLLPKLESVEPSTLNASGSKTVITVRGANFIDGIRVVVGGSDRPTTFVSNTELKAEIQPEDLVEAGALEIQIRNPSPGSELSNKVILTVINPVPAVDSLSPEVVGAGGGSFTLTVSGRNFVPGSEIEFNGRRRVAAWISGTRLSAQIASGEISSVGVVGVRVINPEPGGGTSNQVSFSIKALNPIPRVTAVSPSTIELGVGSQTIVITGTSFVEGASVVIGNDRLTATYVSPTELRLIIDGARFKTTGSVLLLVNNPAPGGGNSNWIRVGIVQPRNPLPILTGISPSTVFAGGPSFRLVLTGSGFIPSSQVQVNGETVPSIFVNSNILTVQMSTDLLLLAETLPIRVVNPEPGGGASAAQALTIINPQPVLSTITPERVVSGGSSFTLTLSGGGFVPESKVLIDGQARTATYISSTQLTLQIRAAEVVAVRTIPVQVVNSTPGGGSSRVLGLVVRESNPLPRMSAIRPSEVRAGGPGFIMTVEGSRFVPESVVRINGQLRETEFVSDSLLVTRIESTEITTPKELTVSVLTPAPGGGQSSSLPLRVLNPVPRITTINPTSVLAGGPEIDLIVFGEGFVTSSVININGIGLPTTLVTGSQLTARIPAAQISVGGVGRVTVNNPSPGGGPSNVVNLTIGNPVPTISRLTPSAVAVGAGEVSVTVEGSGFVPSSILVVNGQNRPAIVSGSNRLSAMLTAADTMAGGVLDVNVSNPEPGGGLSARLQIMVENPTPGLTSLSQSTIAAGSAPGRLTLNGRGFVPTSIVRWNGVSRSTIYASDKSLAIDLLATDLATAGSVTVTVFNPAPGGGGSNPLILSITPPPNPVPIIDRVTPATIVAGSTDALITVNGAGFTSGSTIHWRGAPRATTLVSANEVTARISSADLQLPGVFEVAVVAPAPGGGKSNQLNLEVTPPMTSCQVIRMQSADYYIQNIDLLPEGVIWIGRDTYNTSYESSAIRLALSLNYTTSQKLTREFTASQLSVISAADRTGALNTRLTCYELIFNPITLGTGVTVSVQTTLGQLFDHTREAIIGERVSDFQQLIWIFERLNANESFNRRG